MGFIKHIPLLFISFCCIFAVNLNLVLAERSTYIIHMDKSRMPEPFSDNQQWYQNTIDSLLTDTLSTENRQGSPSLLYTYNNVFNGFSAVLSESELENIKKTPGFITAFHDRVPTLDTTYSHKFLHLNRAAGVWPASDYGKDVIVGVIDTGVTPEHPSFGDDGMTEIPSRWKGGCENPGFDFNSSLCNKKLIGAKYFNEGVKAANPGNSGRNYSARDTQGHGTHTASTVAGNYVRGASFFGYAQGTARGMAPSARLAIYKVIFNEGRFGSDVLAGMDQAVADGVDVISISMGFDGAPLYEDPISIAAFGAMEKGVLVSSSAGNNFTALGNLHNGIPWALTVAAGSMDRWFAGSVTLGNGEKITGWSMFPAKALVSVSNLVFNETLSSCNSTNLLAESFGTIVCDSNITPFNLQAFTISESKNFIDAAIFISNPKPFDDTRFPVPGVIISPEDGARVKSYAANTKFPTVSIEFQETLYGKNRAPVVADYSSRGPSPSCSGVLKPDIMAPGTLVLAAWMPDSPIADMGNIRLTGEFNMISGTSMSTPHASGIAALLKGAHPEWSPAAIRSAMVTTANPLDNHGDPITDSGFNFIPANPTSMGAGQVDPNSAMDPGLIYDAGVEDYIGLLCSMNFTQKQIATIARSSSFNCSGKSADLNYPSFIVLYEKNSTVKSELSHTFERTVTNVGNGATSYKARVSAPKGSTVTVQPERLVFGEKNEKRSYTLSINYRAGLNESVTSGSVVWVEENGKHRVRSPIAVAPMIPVW